MPSRVKTTSSKDNKINIQKPKSKNNYKENLKNVHLKEKLDNEMREMSNLRNNSKVKSEKSLV